MTIDVNSQDSAGVGAWITELDPSIDEGYRKAVLTVMESDTSYVEQA